jgi:regulatory protein
MPLITEVRAVRSAGTATTGSSPPAAEPEWRLLVLADGRQLRVDVEQMARHHLEAGAEVAPEIVASLQQRDAYLRARDRALRLLAVRPRSAAEMHAALRRHGLHERTIRAVLADLAASHIVDDEAFARAWVARRLGQAQGARRIRWELRNRGVVPEVIDRAIAETGADSGTGRRLEEENALALVRRRLRRVAGLAPAQRARRVAGLLERRGFSAETIARVLRVLGQPDGAEVAEGSDE